MQSPFRFLALVLFIGLLQAGLAAEEPAKRTPREALKAFNVLIGSWRGTGIHEGRAADKQKDAWEETIRWEWQFKDSDAWLKVVFDKGKYFVEGTLRYLPDKNEYQLTLTSPGKQSVAFTGPLKNERLLLERRDEGGNETHRLVISLLHDNRYLYHYEVQPKGHPVARKLYRVGATKEGVPFVKTSDEIGPFCVVSYGTPDSPVTYKGKTYYVCCSSCRAEFLASPEKYIKEYEEMLAKMKAEKRKKK